MRIPFLDLGAQYETIRTEIDASIAKVIAGHAFAGGPFVETFERQFAAFCRTEFAIGVANGTEALWLALLALGIRSGDEVITVPNTFIATAEAIAFCGAKPVFVDVDDKTQTLDPSQLERALTPRTAAVIPVHLYGQMADMDPIMAFAQRHGLFVIEDACQAHGAEYKGRSAGSIGHMGCFSFYPGKNLGAYGEAGAVVTGSPQWASDIKMLRDHGQSRKYHHRMVGWNSRMDGIQGAILSVKLKHLRQWNEKRRMHAAQYNQLLKEVPEVITPFEADYGRHVYHVYALRSPRRDALRAFLSDRSIENGVHYPVPLHRQAADGLYDPAASFPVAERCAAEVISLPMYPELSGLQISHVVDGIKAFYRR
jgi:dTDP-4-amino-4,6-dideoxygalactose transaminase